MLYNMYIHTCIYISRLATVRQPSLPLRGTTQSPEPCP